MVDTVGSSKSTSLPADFLASITNYTKSAAQTAATSLDALNTTSKNLFNSNVIGVTGNINAFKNTVTETLNGALGSLGSQGLSALKNAASASESDFRVRLSAQPGAGSTTPGGAYGPKSPANLLNPLYETNGMMFPYTPSISYSEDVEYASQNMSQTNTDYMSYTKTPSVKLTVAGKFTVQSNVEGMYALACIHFLRTSSKMYFGEKAAKQKRAGLPPPILLFNGYGSYMYNNLKVILTSHSFNYDEGMDTVLITTAGGTARLPALFSITCSLTVQQTPSKMRKEFDLDAFRTGELMKKGGWL